MCATSRPATAGPAERARLVLTAPSADAAGNSSRGTISGITACQVGRVSAWPAPSRNVKTSSSPGGIRSSAVSTVSTVPAPSSMTCTASSSRRRSKVSASVPDGSASSSTGSVVAVCTRLTHRAASLWWTTSHCAPTVCIQVPTLLASTAIQSIRKIGARSGAHGLS